MEIPIAFIVEEAEQPGLEIRVNFGVFAGREATPAEIDELARLILLDVADVSIVSEQRHEISDDVEAAVHQVRVEIAEDELPADADEREQLAERVVATADLWARTSAAARHAEVSEL